MTTGGGNPASDGRQEPDTGPSTTSGVSGLQPGDLDALVERMLSATQDVQRSLAELSDAVTRTTAGFAATAAVMKEAAEASGVDPTAPSRRV